MTEIHTVPFKVRDYELDIQGVVNNSVYGNYYEHARHEFLMDKGVNFAELAERGVNLVVVKIEIDYRRSLRSRDRFRVETETVKESKIKFQFKQRIKLDDGTLISSAVVTGVAVDARKNRPMRLDQLSVIFET